MNFAKCFSVCILIIYFILSTDAIMQKDFVPITNSIIKRSSRVKRKQPFATNVNFRQQNSCTPMDPSSKAYRASVVIEAKIRSMSSDRRLNYSITFQILNVYKDVSGFRTLLKYETIRLHFLSTNRQKHNDQCPQTDLTVNRWRFKPGKLYLLFMHRTGIHEFKISDEPIPKSRRNLNDVQAVLKNAKPAILTGLRKSYLINHRERLRLVCRVRGVLPVTILWFKDGQDLQQTKIRRIRIQRRKRRTILTISKTRSEDSGQYKCQARSLFGEPLAILTTLVTVRTEARPENSSPCPIPDNSYCLNGGTCLYFETVGEPACKCAEGFNGQRCENKDVTNKSSMYRPQSFSCKLGLSTSYYC